MDSLDESISEEESNKKIDPNQPTRVQFHRHCKGIHSLPFRKKLPKDWCDDCMPDERHTHCPHYNPISAPNLKNIIVY